MVSGGKREGAGRKSRPTSKAKGIWCGQIPEPDRVFILQWLSPEKRYKVLMAAANKACSGLADTYEEFDTFPKNLGALSKRSG